jgi:cyanophycinase
MEFPLKPIYLLADSQLLFWENEGQPLLAAIAESENVGELKAAYLGASNGDQPEFYSIFEWAMEKIGIRHCRMITSAWTEEDQQFLVDADVILLAGGDVRKGWQVFEATGIKDQLIQRYYAGAWLIGVSAGAIQLGLKGWTSTGDGIETFDTLKLIPYILDAHAEKSDWADLKQAVAAMKGAAYGIGLPAGGGAIYHADHTLEPIRHPIYEIATAGDSINVSLLIAGSQRLDD